ncbi:MAG: hypothetical protein ACJA2X_001412 [Halocynthiibacter sp.]|jgi:hypothetical protein
MPTDQIFDDVWALQSGVSNVRTQRLPQIKEIDEVLPLDDQFGASAPKTVPDAIFSHLFGQQDPTHSESVTVGGDIADAPPLKTYAILDAAKVTNLVELLGNSRLEHRCLFKGDAYEELKDVAPWIVRLEEGNTFTRNLFSRSNAPWHLWDKEPGIYLRSNASLDEMWRHFRKFTKVQDEKGKWYYYRFWEVRVLAEARNEQLVAFFEYLHSEAIATMICIDTFRNRARIFVPNHANEKGSNG